MPTTLLEPGQLFAGRYRVLRLIAPGGMGAVFEAEHIGTERHVALKLLWPHIMEVQSAREKFELEAKVAARVQSEHIVHVLDAGFDEATSAPYLVMELLHGKTLAAFVETHKRVGAEQTVQLLQQVAKGLDAAHSLRNAQGALTPLIHRDLKPENLLLVQRDGAPPLVKILDFGISKVLSESRNMSHEIRGTPMYMAYEQVSAEKLSPQTDIWALGLIAYYMLTGRRYWKSANDPEATMQALFMEIVMTPMALASQRLAEQGADFTLPQAFDGWLERCIDRVPEHRFESASAAIIALEAALRVKLRRARPAPRSQAMAATQPAPLRTQSVTVPELPADSSASTAGSMPALESSAFTQRRGLLQELRVRPLLFAAASALILAGGALVFWRGSPRTAELPAAAGAAPVETVVESLTPPRTERVAPPPPKAGEVTKPVEARTKPVEEVSPPPKAVEATKPSEATKPTAKAQRPARVTHALQPAPVKSQPEPVASPRAASQAPKRIEPENTEQAAPTPAPEPLNPFNTR